MADDFSKTTIYEENKELAGEVLESLVSSFTTRSNNSDWLSKDGAKAIKEKPILLLLIFIPLIKTEISIIMILILEIGQINYLKS